MPGAGSAHVTDRDKFLDGAINAATANIRGEDDRDGPPEPTIQRPGTEAYGGKKAGAEAIAHPKPKKKRPKKKVTKKKRTKVVADAPSVPPEYEDPGSPSLDDIERAKTILARADQLGSPFVEGPKAPALSEETQHTAVAEQFQIDDIDDEMVEDVPDAPSPPEGAKEHVPAHLKEHDCGLPECLMQKKDIAKYLSAHGIGPKTRKEMDINEPEKELYAKYTKAAKMYRVTMGHFVAALRMWRNGYPINPKESVDLNAMKVGV